MFEHGTQRFLEARRAYISSCFSNLNDMQQKAVMSTEGPLLLLAGAGSGKTTVLINRIANLVRFGDAADTENIPTDIDDDDVAYLLGSSQMKNIDKDRLDRICCSNAAKPWEIIAITFTNKAANELKERLHSMLGEMSEGIWAMTFHSACCRILRRNIDYLGYTSDFTIYDSSDSEKVMKEVIKDIGLDEKSFPAKSVLSAISDAKDRLETAEQMMKRSKYAGDVRAERIAGAYAKYQLRLQQANALDFDDIILLTVRLLEEYEDVRDYYQRKFKYVLIDEYQDTNNLQYKLATLLSGRYENICVVGDDDQSIYRFRGATIENILSFESKYSSARVIRLEQNYRSTQFILDAANAVIANNVGRKGKKLWTSNEEGEKIEVYEAYNENGEASFVANQIIKGKANGGKFKDCAILYRTNAQSNAIEMAFKKNGIPYRIIGGTRFFDRAEVKDMLAYLHLVNNRSDDLRLRRIVNLPARGIGGKTLETIERQAGTARLSLFDVIEDAASYPALEKSVKKLTAFSEMINDLRIKADNIPLPEFYDELVDKTGYIKMLEEKDSEENRSRKENVKELRSSIISYVESAESPSLRGFLEEVSLYTDIEKNDPDADAAVMMTMHSAKGLEFPVVFLVGAEDGLFPGTRVLSDPTELEEERRLCYVAITRAKKLLYVTWAKQRMLYGRTTYNKRSRFIDEIPDECIKNSQRKVTAYEGYQKTAGQYSKQAGSTSSWKEKYERTIREKSGSVKMIELRKGDMIEHTAFGVGMVLSVLPVGGDALIEVMFDNVGTKRLMAKTASSHIRKK